MAKLNNSQTDEFIWEWYQIFEHLKEIGMGQPEYCKRNNIRLSLCRSMSWKIIYRSRSLNGYKKFMDIAKEYDPNKMTIKEYANLKKVSSHQIVETLSHIRALEAIERMKKKLESESQSEMKFIEVPPGASRTINMVQEAQILPKKNDIELVIDKGIRVHVSPEVSSEKLIKIIELLKDL